MVQRVLHGDKIPPQERPSSTKLSGLAHPPPRRPCSTSSTNRSRSPTAEGSSGWSRAARSRAGRSSSTRSLRRAGSCRRPRRTRVQPGPPCSSSTRRSGWLPTRLTQTEPVRGVHRNLPYPPLSTSSRRNSPGSRSSPLRPLHAVLRPRRPGWNYASASPAARHQFALRASATCASRAAWPAGAAWAGGLAVRPGPCSRARPPWPGRIRSTRASGVGSHQFARPNSATSAGTSRQRTITASMRMPGASPVARTFRLVCGPVELRQEAEHQDRRGAGDQPAAPAGWSPAPRRS